MLKPPEGPGDKCQHDGTTCLGWGDTSLVYEDDGWQGTGGRTHAVVIGVGKYAESRPRRGKAPKPFETLPWRRPGGTPVRLLPEAGVPRARGTIARDAAADALASQTRVP